MYPRCVLRLQRFRDGCSSFMPTMFCEWLACFFPRKLPRELFFFLFKPCPKHESKSSQNLLNSFWAIAHLPPESCPRHKTNSIDHFLGPRECNAWVNFGEERGFEQSFHKQTSEMAHRDNGRISLHSPEVAAAVFARVSPFVPGEMEGRCAFAVICSPQMHTIPPPLLFFFPTVAATKIETIGECIKPRRCPFGPCTAVLSREKQHYRLWSEVR